MSSPRKPFFFVELLLLLTMLLVATWFLLDCWSKAGAVPLRAPFYDVAKPILMPHPDFILPGHDSCWRDGIIEIYPGRGYREQ